MQFEIREMTTGDYDDAVALWNSVEGIGLDDDTDTRGKIGEYLVRNAGLSFAAYLDGRMVGVVLCGHDGRRGYLHHLAVAASCRGQGLGRALADRCMSALRDAGINKCNIFVFSDNDEGLGFWRATGWNERTDLLILQRWTEE